MRSRVKVCGIGALMLGVAGLLGIADAERSWGGEAPAKFVADELLVQFKAGVSRAKADEALRGAGAAEAGELEQLRVKRIKVPPQALEKVKATLARNPHVTFVENNHLATGSGIPNDPSYASQWHHPKIASPSGWDISTGSATVDIAIIDSGVDPAHPDLASKLLPGYSFLTGTTNASDVLGHGTAVAGSAAAIANNGAGVAGVAWKNMIMPLVVLDSSNYASYSNIAQAITYAADRGVRVMNVSIGGSSSSSTLQSAVNYAWNKGALIFASAMNNNTSTPYFPAACTNVVAVAATNSADAKASFSNYGTWITLAAPGEYIYTTNRGGGYGAWNGTSFASPITAGLAALILSINPALTNAQVVDILKQNADDLGTAGFDQYFGHGRINAYRSLLAARDAVPQTDTSPPSVSISSPAGGSVVKGTVSAAVAASDNVGVSRVELFVDGNLLASTTIAPFTFSWDTTPQTDGVHILKAQAYDAAGNIAQSSQTNITVANTLDNIAPTVTFTSPANGSIVNSRATISIAASDNVRVSRIELSIDGQLVASANGSNTLAYTWNTRKASAGPHAIAARAFDYAGNSSVTSLTVIK